MISPLNYLIGAPLLGAFLILLVPRNYRFVIRLIALSASFAAMAVGIWLFGNFDPQAGGYQFEGEPRYFSWVESLGINYHLGADGINIGLLLMGAIVAFAATAVSWPIRERVKEFYLLLLLMITGILGAFASLDLFFFYFFHELALVPTFIMIGVWGRGENKNYATFQITLYLSIGALISLIGLIALYLQLPVKARTFDLVNLTAYFSEHTMALPAQNLIFPLLLFGFGILVSLWPFHSWAPAGYGAAPTATAMLHAGVLKKFGLYGLIRIALPFMPMASQSWMHIVAFLCLGNIVYCGLVAMRQRDLNLLIGNSSVAHMGFVFLGIASLSLVGITGAVVVMIAHGFLAALSFALTGYLEQQTRTLNMDEMGGLLRTLPFVGAALIMAMMAGCGLPGFANFPGEAMVLFSGWKGFPLVTILATWGALVIGAVYMLRAIRCILHGPLAADGLAVIDAPGAWRKLPFCLLIGSLLLFGFFPRLLTEKIGPSASQIVSMATSQIVKTPRKKAAKRPARKLAMNPAPERTWQ